MSEIVKVRFAKGWLSRAIEDACMALMAQDLARKNPKAVLDAAAEITRLRSDLATAREDAAAAYRGAAIVAWGEFAKDAPK